MKNVLLFFVIVPLLAVAQTPTQGLFAYYPFNGNANDATGHGRNGTVNGATLTTDRFGAPNRAYYFNGTSSFIDLGTSLHGLFPTVSVTTPTYTISGWAQCEQTSFGGDGYSSFIISQSDGVRDWERWYIGQSAEHNHFCNVTVTDMLLKGYSLEATTPSRIADSTWYQFVMVFDGPASGVEKVRLYINGQLVGQTASVSRTIDLNRASYNPPVLIGAGSGSLVPNRFFKGKIDDVKFYSCALNDSDIVRLYREEGTAPVIEPPHAPAVPALIAYYPFNGSALDASGNHFDGVVNGAELTADRFGNANSAYSFDGATAHILLGDILDSVFAVPQATFTVTGWARCASTNPGGGNNSMIVSKSSGAFGTSQWGICQSAELNHFCEVVGAEDYSSSIGAASATRIPDDAWYQFAMVFNGRAEGTNQLRFYIDGQRCPILLPVGFPTTTTPNTSQPVIIGGGISAAGFINMFQGTIDDIRIFNYALSDSAVVGLFEQEKPATLVPLPPPPPVQLEPVAYYPFNGDARDASGNNYHGTVFYATLTSDRFGNPSSAYEFNGVFSNISLGDVMDDVFCAPIAKFTVTGWALCTNGDSDMRSIISKSTGGLYGNQWFLGQARTGTPYSKVFFNNAANSMLVKKDETEIATGTWYQFAMVFDGSANEADRLQYYINGKRCTSVVANGTRGMATPNTSQPILIGGAFSTTPVSMPNVGTQIPYDNMFAGKIDDIRIYKYALSDSAVTALYNSEKTDDVVPPPAPVFSGLVAYYPFNGNPNDMSGNAFNGTNNGATLTTDRLGRANSAYYFNGTTSHIVLGDILDSVFCAQTATFTVTGWAQCYDTNPGGNDPNSCIISKTSGYPFESQWGIMQSEALRHFCQVLYANDYSSSIYSVSDAMIADSTWYQFAMVYNGNAQNLNRLRFYVNGRLMTDTRLVGTNMTTTPNTSQPIIIGGGFRPGSPNNMFKGKIDNIRIYSQSLSDTAVMALYQAERDSDLVVPPVVQPVSVPGLVAYYPFNGNARDESWHTFDGTVNGAVLTTDRYGRANSAYQFDGASAHILLGNILDSVFCANRATFTVMGWAMCTKTNPGGNDPSSDIITKTSGIPGLSEWGICQNSALNHFCQVLYANDYSSSIYAATATRVPDSSWYQFAMVYDGNAAGLKRLQYYINGQLVSFTTLIGTNATTLPATTQPIIIGGGFKPGSPNNMFQGKIDDIRIYNRALADTSISALFEQEKPQIVVSLPPFSTAPKLVAYYPFNGNANDETGSGLTGKPSASYAGLGTDRFGKPKAAYSFIKGDQFGQSNTGGRVSLGNVLNNVFSAYPATFSITGWALCRATPAGNSAPAVLIQKSAGTPDQSQWSLSQNEQGGLQASVVTSATGEGITRLSRQHVPDGTWFHFALTFDGSKPDSSRLQLYCNGIPVDTPVILTSLPGVTTPNTTAPVDFGSTLDGKIDDIRIYRGVLGKSEILLLYQQEKPPMDTTIALIGWYPLNGNANDESGEVETGMDAWPNYPVVAADRSRKAGQALDFNGTQYLVLGRFFEYVTSAKPAVFSISGWANSRATKTDTTDSMSVIIAKGPVTSSWMIAQSRGRGIFAEVATESNGRMYITADTTIADSSWYHFAFVFDGRRPIQERMMLYINGKQSSATPVVIGNAGISTLGGKQLVVIGGRLECVLSRGNPDFVDKNSFFDGTIDDIRIFRGALTSEQVLKLTRDTTTTLAEVSFPPVQPKEFALDQNYPNPFNPTTTIRYRVAQPSVISIRIYNLLGNEVATLVNEYKNPGVYLTTWNGAGHASGMYFYRMTVSGSSKFTQVRKLLLVK